MRTDCQSCMLRGTRRAVAFALRAEPDAVETAPAQDATHSAWRDPHSMPGEQDARDLLRRTNRQLAAQLAGLLQEFGGIAHDPQHGTEA